MCVCVCVCVLLLCLRDEGVGFGGGRYGHDKRSERTEINRVQRMKVQ